MNRICRELNAYRFARDMSWQALTDDMRACGIRLPLRTLYDALTLERAPSSRTLHKLGMYLRKLRTDPKTRALISTTVAYGELIPRGRKRARGPEAPA